MRCDTARLIHLVWSQDGSRLPSGGRRQLHHALYIWFRQALHESYDTVLEEPIPHEWREEFEMRYQGPSD